MKAETAKDLTIDQCIVDKAYSTWIKMYGNSRLFDTEKEIKKK